MGDGLGGRCVVKELGLRPENTTSQVFKVSLHLRHGQLLLRRIRIGTWNTEMNFRRIVGSNFGSPESIITKILWDLDRLQRN